jgi:hypothetical protein
MPILTMKTLRFNILEYGQAEVLARHKVTRKWHVIGVCHSASVPILKASLERFAELVKITYKAA